MATAAALAAVVAFASWPRGDRLEWYTSPLVQGPRKRVRLKLLLPSGWKVDLSRQWLDGLLARREWALDGHFPATSLVVEPVSRFAWLPHFLRDWLRIPKTEDGAFLAVCISPVFNAADRDEPILSSHKKMYDCEIHDADKAIVIGSQRCWLKYRRLDRGRFDDTYRQICESFRVIQ